MSNAGFSVIYGSISKFDGTNWFSFKKDVQAYLALEALWDIVEGTEKVPSDTTEVQAWTRKDIRVYSLIYFLIDSDFRETIAETNSGSKAWSLLIQEYQKDTSATRLALRNQFYSIRHDPAKPIGVFLGSVQSTVRQLNDIGHKPTDSEICDIILLRLHPSFTTVRSAIVAREKALKLADLIAMVKEYEGNENVVKKAEGEGKLEVKQEVKTEENEAMYARDRGKGRGEHRERDFDWGNTMEREGVCFRCGRPNHQAARCVADMPKEVKERILHAGIATVEDDDDDLSLPNVAFFVDDVNTNITVGTIGRDDMSNHSSSGLTGVSNSPKSDVGLGNQGVYDAERIEGVQGTRGCDPKRGKLRSRRGRKREVEDRSFYI